MKNTIITLVALLLITTSVIAQSGEMDIKVGYVITDEQDNLGVNQETFNTYEGPAFSINNFYLGFDNGIKLNGDLTNVSLNNRNMNMAVSKTGLAGLSFYNNQYRRTYSADGASFTRRESTGLNGYIKPHKNLKIFGGFDYLDKDGSVYNLYRPTADMNEYDVNYTQYSYNVGGLAECPYGNARYEYKRITFENDLDFSRDRQADVYNLSLFSSLPSYRWFTVAGGYYSRADELFDRPTDLKTNSIWGAGKIYLKQQWLIDFRTIFSNTEHNADMIENENKYYTLSVTKAFNKVAGLRVGYEIRNADDKTNRTEADGYLLSGWYNYNSKLFIKGRYSFISKIVDDGETLIGDTENSRHSLSVKYKDSKWGSLSGKLEKRIKKYDDIDTEVDYTSASAALALKSKSGKLVFSYKYNVGEYNNRSNQIGFEFSDHILSTSLYPKPFGDFQAYLGASYYRSQRDIDLEKFSLKANVDWEFIPLHHFDISYRVYTYDDLMAIDDSYTANNIEINLIKELKF